MMQLSGADASDLAYLSDYPNANDVDEVIA